MTTKELGQVVISPDAIGELEAAVQLALEREEPVRIGRRLRLRLALAPLLHVVGVHHWIRLREYDAASDRIIETGDWICGMPDCPAARHG